MLSGTDPHGPVCLSNDLQVVGGAQLGRDLRVCGRREASRLLGLLRPSPRVFLPEAGKTAAPRQDRNGEKPACRCSPGPARLPCEAGAHCWDKSALLLAFIFSRRFTKWPLLTSSSSVLSSAERSWEQGGEATLRLWLPPNITGLPRPQSYRKHSLTWTH